MLSLTDFQRAIYRFMHTNKIPSVFVDEDDDMVGEVSMYLHHRFSFIWAADWTFGRQHGPGC
jgi:hypothetical protein